MKLVSIYIAVLFILLAIHTGIANDYYINYLTSDNGLSKNEVTAILQDSKGFMWFGTRGGLNVYDGYDFVKFKTKIEQKHSLSNSSIQCLLEDHNGNLWIGTKSGGLNFYDQTKEQFTRVIQFGKYNQHLPDNTIVDITESDDGKIIVGTESNGIYVLDTKKDSVTYILESDHICKILNDSDNILWIGSNNGLTKLNLTTLETTKSINIGKFISITGMISDPDGDHLWITGWEGGLTKYNKKTGKWNRLSLNTEDKKFNSVQNNTQTVLLDSNNKLWIGTWGGGLYNYNKEKNIFNKVEILPNFQQGFNTNYNIILDIFEDKDKNIWIGTDGGGIVQLGTRKSFHGISLDKDYDCGLKSFHIKSEYESDDGYLWIGTRGGGLYRTLDKKNYEHIPSVFVTGESLIVNYIWQFVPNILWVSTGSDLFQLDLSQKNLRLIPFHDPIIFNIKKITAILKLDNDLLIGTHFNGIYIFSNYFIGGKDIKHIITQNNPILKSNRITFLKKDNNGKIWVGTYNGLYQYDHSSKSILLPRLLKGEVLTSETINCLAESSDSVIWVGTPCGLNKLLKKENGYSITHFYKESGLLDDDVLGILSDNENHIWMSTNSGIDRINVRDNIITTFDKSNGLHGMNFSDDQCFKNKNGILYFGGINGFTYFDPLKIDINENVPPVVFTRFKVFNQEIQPDQKVNGRILLRESIKTNPHIELTYKEKEFTIEFSALNYNASQQNLYKYKMEGYDQDWSSAGTKRSVTYSNLDAGRYEFKVKGSNNNNVWNEESANLIIDIKPALWKTWYALLFYIVFLMGVVLLIRWNAIKQLRLVNSLEMEKVKQAQEHQLNEMKMQFFTNISHEFRTPLTLILGPIKEMLDEHTDNRKLNMVYKNANRLLRLVNQLLEFRKIEKDTLNLKVTENNIIDFVKEVCISFQELANINHIKFETKLNLISKWVWFDAEQMEIVLNNFISNAFKYAGSGAVVEILIDESEEFVEIHVIDNGPGIAEDEISNVFNRFFQSNSKSSYGSSGIGLYFARKLVELHSGEIMVESIPNQKTEFTVKLRKGNKHFSDEQKVENSFVQQPVNEKQWFLPTLKLSKVLEIKSTAENSMLIVEDNPEIRDYLKDLFDAEFQISMAENGKAGYEKAFGNYYDIIISDVIMPEMDGMEMCEKLKLNPKTSHIPIILLTAKSASQFRFEGFSKGADAYISKPFNPEELKVQVRSILLSRKRMKEKYCEIIKLEPSDIEITPHEKDFIESIIKIIELNIKNTEFNSEQLAQHVGMSPITLYRKLKSIFGQSSNEIIRTIRLKRAAQLLTESNFTISEIVYMVGFNDVKYFRKCFIQQFKVTPSEFRNR